ncbi:MAG: ATP-binding protein [Synergistaceae bacterium]|jgi:hypothetical protein|nr:ATP-binding protein [Synergistaceae bacterium]
MSGQTTPAGRGTTPRKFFNTAGPAQEDIHYTLDPLRRVNYEEIALLMDQRKYFVLHAPRQTGKTTSLLAMTKRINEEEKCHCVYINVEAAQTARNDVASGMRVVMSEFAGAVERFLSRPMPGSISSIIDEVSEYAALSRMLENFCGTLDRPLVLLVDEIDALIGDSLVSILRQFRKSYEKRPSLAPASVILCGVRDIRDYRIHRSDGEIITGGSCFNIKAESLRLGDFSPEEIRELYLQHTAATGQIFEENIYPKVWSLTHGQPWLVNALAHQATFTMPEGRDRTRPITLETVEEAANLLILERATHLDQLADKLGEPRVRRVIAPIVAGENWTMEETPLPDDVQYVIDLGLLRREGDGPRGALVISNGIYREIIPRELTTIMQDNLSSIQDNSFFMQDNPSSMQDNSSSRQEQPWRLGQDGRLDMPKLLRAFQRFFRENSESWLERFDYKEAGFQLLLQAFLQRIVNGGDLIDREYALGRGRVDLLVRWRYPQGAGRADQREQRIVLELKTIRAKSHDPERAFSAGLEQTVRYAERSDAAEAHLIVCDERPGRSWDEKIYERVERRDGKDIRVWGV